MAKKKRKPKGTGPKGWGRFRPDRPWPRIPKRAAPPRDKPWRQAAGQPETAAKLERLPAGLEFPDVFPEPIAYDPRRQLLIYRGLMTHDSYAYLRLLSVDPAYLAAL